MYNVFFPIFICTFVYITSFFDIMVFRGWKEEMCVLYLVKIYYI